jgi:hypothetical protein
MKIELIAICKGQSILFVKHWTPLDSAKKVADLVLLFLQYTSHSTSGMFQCGEYKVSCMMKQGYIFLAASKAFTDFLKMSVFLSNWSDMLVNYFGQLTDLTFMLDNDKLYVLSDELLSNGVYIEPDSNLVLPMLTLLERGSHHS